ncbi:MAG: hypothetical protein PHO63_04375 [Bacilli bacterium]|nr:hypothetical protein [Bacilli bacterium]MDD4809309.1 hypothetical protein [Bacilli bacterium]
MKKRIIIGKNGNEYYYHIKAFDNGEWNVIEQKNKEANKQIEHLLDVKINKVRWHQNLLIVKTNDDLIVIDDYQQLNHDKVFKNLNKQLSKKIINNEQLTKNLKLQKEKNNHKAALLANKFLCCAVLTSSLLIPINGATILNDITPPKEEIVIKSYDQYRERQSEKLLLMQNQLKIEQKAAEQKQFVNTVKKYSDMYCLDYTTAFDLIKENEETIKNDYINQEVGIIRTLADAFYHSSIDKTPQVTNISPLEREKLLLQFAKVYDIQDVDTLATMLAVHRLETGNGKSKACVYKNNFGGLRARNSKTGSYYVMSFKTPSIGAERMVRTFLDIKNRAIKSKHYNPNRSLEENMNHIYCGEKNWPILLKQIKNEVINDYELNNYINYEEPKQLIK